MRIIHAVTQKSLNAKVADFHNSKFGELSECKLSNKFLISKQYER